MTKAEHYLKHHSENPVYEILKGIDRDVERGEDVLMLGLGVVMLSSTFAPVVPPIVLLPLIAATFAISSGFARNNYLKMERKIAESMALLLEHEKEMLHPISSVFVDSPRFTLAESFNPLKNLKRTWKSALGGLLINPLWMPIFYMMGLQISEEKMLGILNRAIIGVEQKLSPPSSFD